MSRVTCSDERKCFLLRSKFPVQILWDYLQFLSDAVGCYLHFQNKLVSDDAGDARESTHWKRHLAWNGLQHKLCTVQEPWQFFRCSWWCLLSSWFMAPWQAPHMVHLHHPQVLRMQQGCKCLWFGTNPLCSLYVCIVPDCNRRIAHPRNCIQFHMVLIYCEGQRGVEGTKFNISAKYWHVCRWSVKAWIRLVSPRTSYHPSWLHTQLECYMGCKRWKISVCPGHFTYQPCFRVRLNLSVESSFMQASWIPWVQAWLLTIVLLYAYLAVPLCARSHLEPEV